MDQQRQTEEKPTMEIHCGEVFVSENEQARHFILWLNGKRWEGTLFENTDRDINNLKQDHD